MENLLLFHMVSSNEFQSSKYNWILKIARTIEATLFYSVKAVSPVSVSLSSSLASSSPFSVSDVDDPLSVVVDDPVSEDSSVSSASSSTRT